MGDVMIKRADWVTCKSPSSGRMVGCVKRMAKDGSWADVDWGQRVKRMPTRSLEPQHTIPFAGGTVTDVTRQRELEANDV